jgi:hypothetical protein
VREPHRQHCISNLMHLDYRSHFLAGQVFFKDDHARSRLIIDLESDALGSRKRHAK